MKTRSLCLLALALLLGFVLPPRARALEVSFDFFYESLAPHGEWIEVEEYGYCWRPTGMDEEWAPYADGYWTYTDAGWTWVSYEEFGGIVYHYGRWARVEDEGWVWVPDYEWGPAWVSWRRGDDYVGWAPLPAEARWRRDRGFSVWVDTSYDIGPSHYSFCRIRDFGAPVLRPVIVRRAENVVIIGNTVNITNISYNEGAGCAFNGGLDFNDVNRFAQRPVPALKLVRNTNVTVVNKTIINNNIRVTNFNAVQRGNQLSVIAPAVVRPQPAQLTKVLQPEVKRVIPRDRINKGWNIVPNAQRDVLRAKFQQEAKGLTPDNTPAKPVRAAELQVLPQKADPKAQPPAGPRLPQPKPVIAEQPPVRPPAPPAAATPAAPAQEPKGVAIAPPLDPPDREPARPATGIMPPAPTKPVRIKPAKAPTPMPQIASPENPGRPPVAADDRPPVRPGVPKPLNPPIEPATPSRSAEMQAEAQRQAVANARREAAAQQAENLRRQQEVARERAAEAAAARQRPKTSEPPAIRPPVPPPAAGNPAAAVARQRVLEQQEAARELATRREAQEAQRQRQVVMEAQQQQAAARARAQQQQQQQQAQQKAQQQAEARREAAERAAAPRQVAPPVRPQIPNRLQPAPPAAPRPQIETPPQPRSVPPQSGRPPIRGGKRPGEEPAEQ